MKVLELSPRPPVFKRLGMTVPKNDREFIESEIRRWISSSARNKQIESDRYYDGDHDILKRKRTVINDDGKLEEVDNLPNNRIVDNQYAKAVDQKANYLCGKPITFDCTNKAYSNALCKVLGVKFDRLLKLLAENAIIGGKVWLVPFFDREGKLSFELLRAYEILPFWADSGHTELDCAVHFYPVWDYDADNGKGEIVNKVEVIHGGGIDRFIWDNELKPDPDAKSGTHVSVTKNGKTTSQNWQKMPLICFKANHREQPLLVKVKCLQDALNLMLSNFTNNMEEDVRNTILIIENYDGEDLGSFRHNLATYGAIKVRTVDGVRGGVNTLHIEVNAENYKTIIELLKKAIIENARSFDAKDERTKGTPNQMNIKSMYSDIDLDANAMETEFKAAFEDLLWFVNMYLINTGVGDFTGETVKIIFNRDVMFNETERIENANKAGARISQQTALAHHPWVTDVPEEQKRIEEEEKKAKEKLEEYSGAFATGNTNAGGDDE